jgi:hypothetical protein
VDDDNRKGAVQSLLQLLGNVRDESSAEGNLSLGPSVLSSPVTLPTDGNDELTFLRYRTNHPLAQMGTNKSYVGVPPVE